jgi:hypothetical protein
MSFRGYPVHTSASVTNAGESSIDGCFTGHVFASIEKLVKLNVPTVKTSLSEQQAPADVALSVQPVSDNECN